MEWDSKLNTIEENIKEFPVAFDDTDKIDILFYDDDNMVRILIIPALIGLF